MFTYIASGSGHCDPLAAASAVFLQWWVNSVYFLRKLQPCSKDNILFQYYLWYSSVIPPKNLVSDLRASDPSSRWEDVWIGEKYLVRVIDVPSWPRCKTNHGKRDLNGTKLHRLVINTLPNPNLVPNLCIAWSYVRPQITCRSSFRFLL